MPVLNPLETAVADQMERDSRDAVRDVRRMMKMIRSIPQETACSECGGMFAYRHMTNVNVGHAPRWVCPGCLWPKAGN